MGGEVADSDNPVLLCGTGAGGRMEGVDVCDFLLSLVFGGK
jgi:hypothetical protein